MFYTQNEVKVLSNDFLKFLQLLARLELYIQEGNRLID